MATIIVRSQELGVRSLELVPAVIFSNSAENPQLPTPD
jgi:hypothetical protein